MTKKTPKIDNKGRNLVILDEKNKSMTPTDIALFSGKAKVPLCHPRI
jgi:hypothetical protein